MEKLVLPLALSTTIPKLIQRSLSYKPCHETTFDLPTPTEAVFWPLNDKNVDRLASTIQPNPLPRQQHWTRVRQIWENVRYFNAPVFALGVPPHDTSDHQGHVQMAERVFQKTQNLALVAPISLTDSRAEWPLRCARSRDARVLVHYQRDQHATRKIRKITHPHIPSLRFQMIPLIGTSSIAAELEITRRLDDL